LSAVAAALGAPVTTGVGKFTEKVYFFIST